jgi:cytochrome c oxidase cbb3-type subunit 2
MKNGPLFLLGLFVSAVIAWSAIVLGPHGQLGGLTPWFDEGEGKSHPARPTGLAARGQLVYADLGCASCHTQQVRRPGFGSDQERGWGDRQSVARDYIFQERPQIGSSRIGPDLANFGSRKPQPPSAESLLAFLHSGSGNHPAFPFLFETRKVEGQPSVQALKLSGNAAPAAGFQVVPSERAMTLVAYLLNLNSSYVYPEAKPLVRPVAKEEAKK